jgi:hypothetical protein
MRGAGDVVEPLVLEGLDVRRAVGRHVDQRSRPAPVFVAGIDLEEAGERAGRPRTIEQAGALAGELARAAREGELVAGIEEVAKVPTRPDGRSGG